MGRRLLFEHGDLGIANGNAGRIDWTVCGEGISKEHARGRREREIMKPLCADDYTSGIERIDRQSKLNPRIKAVSGDANVTASHHH